MKQLQADDFKQYSFLSNLSYAPKGSAYAFVGAKVKDGNGYSYNLWAGDSKRKPFPLTQGASDQSFW